MTLSSKPDIKKSNRCPPCPKTVTTFEKCIYWFGIGLGSGLPKKAPGTWGTVGGLLVALPIMHLEFVGFLMITLLGCMVGSYICGKTSELMAVHDDPHIVFDEWVGVWIALLPVVYLGQKAMPLAWISILLVFLLFRLFDILKPFPINWADKKVSGGFGIMLDDILAGIMSAVVWILVATLVLKL